LIYRIFTLSQTEFSSPTVAKEADPLFQLGQAFPSCDQLPTWSTFVNNDRLIRVFIPPNANQHDAISFDEKARRRLSKLSVHSGDMNTLL